MTPGEAAIDERVLLARQPILDRQERLVAYELLYRPMPLGGGPQVRRRRDGKRAGHLHDFEDPDTKTISEVNGSNLNVASAVEGTYARWP